MRRRAFLRAGGMSLGVAAGFGAVGYSAAMTVGAPHPPPRDDDAIPARLRPAQMRTDIDAFADTIVAVGTDPFLTCPRGVFDAARVHALDACTSEMSIREFWRVAATLAAALNDGHVSIQPTFYEKRSEFPLGILRSVAGAATGDTPTAAASPGTPVRTRNFLRERPGFRSMFTK